MTPATVGFELGLAADTLAKLETYMALLADWQERFNLVGRSTLADPWRRHVLDSAQLFTYLPKPTRSLVDMGSGAGFPGLVLAIMGVPQVILVEATAKKCAFLREVARATSIEVEVRAERLEAMQASPVDVITARALAPLADLLRLAGGFLGPRTTCLFLKGTRVEGELTETMVGWRMKVKRHASLSHPDGVLLELKNVHARAGS